MDFTLQRIFSTQRSMIGVIYWPGIDGFLRPLCFSLEDPAREVKIPGITGIPAGRYQVIVSHSNRFNVDTPEILAVPGFTAIRIHPGNTAQDTEGCILPGINAGIDEVLQSRIAFDLLFDRIRSALQRGSVFIKIT